MFFFLNRVLKISLVAAWCGAGLLVWQQRHLAWPLWDWAAVLHDVGWREPAPLPVFDARIKRVLEPNAVQLADPKGRLWNFRLAGLYPAETNALYLKSALSRFDAETRTNMTQLLINRPVRVAHTFANPAGTGIGFVYVD